MNITAHEVLNFNKAYSLLNIAFIVLDQELNIQYANEVASQLFNVEQFALHGFSFLKFWENLQFDALLNENGDVIEKKPIKIQEHFLQWESISICIDEQQRFFLLGKDVTERELVYRCFENTCEELLGFKFFSCFESSSPTNEVYSYLNGIINKIPYHVYWKNTRLEYIACNQLVADFILSKSSKDIIGKTDFDFYEESVAKKFRRSAEHVLQTGQAVFNEPRTLTNKNGVTIHTLISKIPLFNPAGEIMGLVGINVDVTSLKQDQFFAEQTSRMKTDFIANMSHDIRTPLTGVIGLAKIFEEDSENMKQKQHAYWLGESSKQLLHMLNEILDVALADQTSTYVVQEEAFDLRQMLRDIERLQRPSTLVKNLYFNIFTDDLIPNFFIADKTKIHRILINLLGNAIKFTQKGYVEMYVSLLEKNDTHATLQFQIKDTGIGIDKELHTKVFDRFYQVTHAEEDKYSGHGMGLHIARSYAELLDGKIHLRSELGLGSTFYFDLSLKLDPSVQNCTPSLHVPMDSSSWLSLLPANSVFEKESDTPSLNCLLVEDNKIALFTLKNLLSFWGCQFTEATNAEDALQRVQTKDFDLVITDLSLPGISGTELCQKIRAYEVQNHQQPVLIIGLTAHPEEQVRQQCLDAGMNEVHTKPITLDMLTKIKEKYFKNKERMDLEMIKKDVPDLQEELQKIDSLVLFDAPNALLGIGGDMFLFKSLLKAILEKEIPKDLLKLEEAYSQKDCLALEKLAHHIRGGFVYCGALKLVYACQSLERYSKAGCWHLLEPFYQRFLVVMAETKMAAYEWLQNN